MDVDVIWTCNLYGKQETICRIRIGKREGDYKTQKETTYVILTGIVET
jgi:hypothetical protein